MIVLRKSIVRKIFQYFLLFAILLGSSIVFFFSHNQNSISLPVFAAALLIFLLYFLGVYWYEILRPLKSILEQMKALLTGRQYQRIFTKRVDEIGLIAHFFNEVTKNFEKVTHQIQEGKRMLNELEIASQIQKDILPPEVPSVPDLEIIAKNKPAAELGGDNFDFISQGDNTFIYVGDVTGHGVPAAIVMTMVHTLIHTFVELHENAFDVVVQTNRRLKTRIKSTMFMTMLMLRWNHVTKKMTYVGAGHEHLLIYRAEKGQCEVLMTGGIALGMVPDNSKIIKETELPFNKGDVILLYTDGITEARNMAGEMYGLERLKKALETYAPQYGPDGVVHHIARDFSRFVQEHTQEDDATLIAIQLNPENASTLREERKSIVWETSEA